MGAIANLRPDLWGAIIAAVPFVDVLNTMSDTTPAADPAGMARVGQPAEGRGGLRPTSPATAPTTTSRPKPYPPILATGGLSDPRVTYWEPAKWVGAGCASTPPASDPMLLKINMEAGHGGASGRFDFLKEIALDYAFAVWAIERGWEARVIVRAGDRGRRRGAGRDLRPPRAARLRHLRGGPAVARPRWPRGSPPCWRAACPTWSPRTTAQVLGFAYAAPFRPRAAYRYTAEDSVYVAPGR